MLLALAFGRPDLHRFLSEIPEEDWHYWEAGVDLGIVPDPWLQTGTMTAAIVNRLERMIPQKGTPPWYRAEFYLPGFRGRSVEELNALYETPEEAGRRMEAAAKARQAERDGTSGQPSD